MDVDLDPLLRQIVLESPDAFVLGDAKGVIRLWNRGAERIFGHTAGSSSPSRCRAGPRG